MMLINLVLTFLFVGLIEAQGLSQNCVNIFKTEDINTTSFVAAVVHGIHTLYLEPLRYFFEVDAGEKNGIPVVNMNLSDPSSVLLDATYAGYDKSLSSFSLQTMDWVFTNDAPNFLIASATTVEKLGHALHMQEIWTRAKPVYQSLKSNPPKNSGQICDCFNDVKENGILAAMAEVAKSFKKFGSKTKKVASNGWYFGYHFGYRHHIKEQEYESREIVWTPGTVTGSQGWPLYRKMLDRSMISDSDIKILAQFLYCKLNI